MKGSMKTYKRDYEPSEYDWNRIREELYIYFVS